MSSRDAANPTATGAHVRVGLMLATAADEHGRVHPENVVATAQTAEQAGFDSVHVGDHLLHPHAMLDSIVSLATVAATTERIALGPLVMLLALRDPLVVAKQFRSIAAAAPGRLRIGVGVGGEYPQEFAAAGVPLPDRGRRLEDAVVELRNHLTDARVEQFGGLALGPTVADAPPILFAGWRDVALRRAARLGDGWIGYLLSPDGFERRRDVLRSELASLGRTDDFGTGMLVPVHVVDAAHAGTASEEAAIAWGRLTDRADAFPAHLFAAGTADEVTATLAEYVDRGCSELVLAPVDQGRGHARQVDLLASEVLPRLRHLA